MTMTMEDAYQVIKGIRQKKVKLCVDYNRRFSPAMIDLKKNFQAHRRNPQGKPRIYTQEKSRPKWSEEDASMILIRINDESLTYGGVHIDWKEGGGEIIGEACHWLDLICWLLDERPVRITATGSTRLNYVITLEFVNGTIGCIFFSACGSFEYPKELVEIQDHGKIFRSECFVENQYFGLGERTIKKFLFQQDCHPEIGIEGGHLAYLEKLNIAGEEYVQTGTYHGSVPDKGHLNLLRACVDAIRNDEPSPIDEMAGMRATYLSLRAMASIRYGMPLPINIEDWDMYVH
jgi:predicted dehydrogenase